MAFRDKAIPKVMRIDNGRDFTSKPITGFTKNERDRLRKVYGHEWQQIARTSEQLIDCDDTRWLGVTGELGIELIYAIPYSPWSKGTLERWFRTFHDQCGKRFVTYCGNSAVNKPECVDEIRMNPKDVPTIEQARKQINEYLDIYHRTKHRGLYNKTPLEVWNRANRLRRAVENELSFLMDIRGLYKVGANGVRVTIGSAVILYGGKSAALKKWVGRKVLVAVDPDDVSHCWVFTPDREKRRLLARLDPNEFIEPHTCADDAREAIAQKRREQSVMQKAQRAYANKTKTAVQRINEHARAKHSELLATGTDDSKPQPHIVPVRTGLEGVSKSVRKGFESGSYRPRNARDVEELLDDENTNDVIDEQGLAENLNDFIDENPVDDPVIDHNNEPESLDNLFQNEPMDNPEMEEPMDDIFDHEAIHEPGIEENMENLFDDNDTIDQSTEELECLL